jgi:hypothetical protein
MPARFRQHTQEVLGDDAAFVFPVFYGGTGDAGLKILAVMMLVIPDAAGLVKTAEPDDGTIGRLPAHLQALEIVFVIREQVLAEELGATFLQAEEHIRRDTRVIDIDVGVGAGCLGALTATEDEQLVLQGLGYAKGWNEREAREHDAKQIHGHWRRPRAFCCDAFRAAS